MTELIAATTRMFNAVTAVLLLALEQERIEAGVVAGAPAPVATAVAEPQPEKPKRAKKAAEVAAPAPAPAFDPMMDMGGHVGAAPAAPAAPFAMTEAESTAAAQEANKRLVKAFPTKKAGDDMPEGFYKAKAVLTEFGVARTTDLVHAQRVQYVAKIDALIAAKA